MLENVLVTGGSGFVGTAVLAELAARGYTIMATSTGPAGKLLEHPRVKWVRWDATLEPLPAVEWASVGGIVHLAAPRDPFDFPAQAAAVYEVTLASTFRLLEAARRYGVRRLCWLRAVTFWGRAQAWPKRTISSTCLRVYTVLPRPVLNCCRKPTRS